MLDQYLILQPLPEYGGCQHGASCQDEEQIKGDQAVILKSAKNLFAILEPEKIRVQQPEQGRQQHRLVVVVERGDAETDVNHQIGR
ncbi:hypothetical protein D3C86_1838330 [compost metagenome]